MAVKQGTGANISSRNC